MAFLVWLAHQAPLVAGWELLTIVLPRRILLLTYRAAVAGAFQLRTPSEALLSDKLKIWMKTV